MSLARSTLLDQEANCLANGSTSAWVTLTMRCWIRCQKAYAKQADCWLGYSFARAVRYLPSLSPPMSAPSGLGKWGMANCSRWWAWSHALHRATANTKANHLEVEAWTWWFATLKVGRFVVGAPDVPKWQNLHWGLLECKAKVPSAADNCLLTVVVAHWASSAAIPNTREDS